MELSDVTGTVRVRPPGKMPGLSRSRSTGPRDQEGRRGTGAGGARWGEALRH